MIPEANPTVRHESRDVNAKALAIIMLSMITVSVLILFAIRGVYKLNEEYDSNNSRQSVYWSPVDASSPRSPHLEIDLAASLQESRQSQQKRLTTYGWIDKPAGFVHVPIDKAIQQILKKGLPDWEKEGKLLTNPETDRKNDSKGNGSKEQKL